MINSQKKTLNNKTDLGIVLASCVGFKSFAPIEVAMIERINKRNIATT
jgi:hypothetical protein